jgi:hypothetical protein
MEQPRAVFFAGLIGVGNAFTKQGLTLGVGVFTMFGDQNNVT